MNTADPSSPPAAGSPLPWLRLGFRPFYLLAAPAGALELALWLLQLAGFAVLPPHIDARFWHMHEMLFGFTAAVIVGFLFTAGRNWTGLPTPTGKALAAFVILWCLGRVASVSGSYPTFAVIDVAFMPLAAATFADLIVRARSWRNLGIAAILAGFGGLNAAAHLAQMGVAPWSKDAPLLAAVLLVIVLQTVIVGRIFPAFTMNAIPAIRIRPLPWLDRATIASTVVAGAVWLAVERGTIASLVMALAAGFHAARVVRWRFWATLRTPVIWILHLSYAWIPLGLLLLALSAADLVPRSAAIHALSVGAIVGLVYAMITRTARGHTGRPQVASRAEVTAYHLILLAAVARVALPLVDEALRGVALLASGSAVIAALCIYLFIYVPWLVRPRIDGLDG